MEVQWTLDGADATWGPIVRASLVAVLRAWGADINDVVAVELVLGELLSNGVRHAERGVENVVCAVRPGYVDLRVQSSGRPFSEPQRAAPESAEAGRGLQIVRHLCTALVISRDRDINVVSVKVPLRKV